MSKRAWVVATVVVLFLVGSVSPSWAAKGDKRLQFGLLENSPTDDLVSQGQTTELDSSVGYQASSVPGISVAVRSAQRRWASFQPPPSSSIIV